MLEKLLDAAVLPSKWIDQFLESQPGLSQKNPGFYRELRPQLMAVMDMIYDIKVEGAEKLNYEKATVIFGKHQGGLDLFIGMYVEQELPDIIGKDTLYREALPGNVAKHFFNMAGVKPIDRSNPRAALAIMEIAFRDSINNNNHLLLFPEGKRNPGYVGQLKNTSFKILNKLYEEEGMNPYVVSIGSHFERTKRNWLPVQSIQLNVGQPQRISERYENMDNPSSIGLRDQVRQELIDLSGLLPT